MTPFQYLTATPAPIRHSRLVAQKDPDTGYTPRKYPKGEAFNVVLDYVRSHPEGSPCQQIADDMGIVQTTVSSAFRKWEARGLIELRREKVGGRTKLVAYPKGEWK